MRLPLIQLSSDNQQRLSLNPILPIKDEHVIIRNQRQYSSELIGHYNLMHPHRLQVIGTEEWQWFTSKDGFETFTTLLQMKQPPAIIFADKLPIKPEVIELCRQYNIPLIHSTKNSSEVVDILRTYLARRLADTINVSGVMLDVFGLGVLIKGESGLGKSELALELITRGHGLIADDITELAQVSPNEIEGRCPGMLRDFIEVRGLGILNIRLIFGETAVRRKMRLRLIINLIKLEEYHELPRLPSGNEVEEILEVEIRKINLPISEGRNLAALVEAAVRQTILRLRGFTPDAELKRRQTASIYSSMLPLPDAQEPTDND